jgi:hypothetical protein
VCFLSFSYQKTYYLSKTLVLYQKYSFPYQKHPFPIKNTHFPIKNPPFSHQKHPFYHQKHPFPFKNTPKTPILPLKPPKKTPKNTHFPIKNPLFRLTERRPPALLRPASPCASRGLGSGWLWLGGWQWLGGSTKRCRI